MEIILAWKQSIWQKRWEKWHAKSVQETLLKGRSSKIVPLAPTLAPTMVPQGDRKLSKLPGCPKTPGYSLFYKTIDSSIVQEICSSASKYLWCNGEKT